MTNKESRLGRARTRDQAGARCAWGLVFLGMIHASAAQGQGQDLSGLYERLKPTVVTIEARMSGVAGGSLGSGVIIDDEGRIITVSHVVHSADQINVVLANGDRHAAEVLISNQGSDLALIKLRRVPQNLQAAPLGNSDAAKIGSQIVIIGAPFGLTNSLSVGYVSGRTDQGRVSGGELIDVIQTDAAVNQGSSGGPMFDTDGKVVGIVSSIWSKSGGSDGIGFAIAINPARAILLESPSFWTGFEGLFLGPELASALNVSQGGGLLIQHVQSDSLAGRAGLRGGSIHARLFERDLLLGGDVILSIQGTTCDQPHDFSRIRSEVDALKDNEPFTITVLRNGQVVDLAGLVRRDEWNSEFRRKPAKL